MKEKSGTREGTVEVKSPAYEPTARDKRTGTSESPDAERRENLLLLQWSILSFREKQKTGNEQHVVGAEDQQDRTVVIERRAQLIAQFQELREVEHNPTGDGQHHTYDRTCPGFSTRSNLVRYTQIASEARQNIPAI